MKRIFAILLGLLAVLQYRLWLGENNLSQYMVLETHIAEQQQSNEKLIARNQILKQEIIDLKSGTEAIEERARNELGMVKKGETFYRVVGNDIRQSNHFGQ
ncbi:cell division protein FtsB [Shewanella intestini]|uniref:Cell division protein FtsB n=1 Tax=Shewanella intestini TaxID=2017544 RepID=A0ABS5HYN8_9GAMM|nr:MULTISPECIES: cell division protein FtsB [Shewanella]MBR9726524.1 cell division protein FtsB [Shewanella intestini]MRG34910.1 cell division protein FtsB [Shewanella sp. XMDDZSB0408]